MSVTTQHIECSQPWQRDMLAHMSEGNFPRHANHHTFSIHYVRKFAAFYHGLDNTPELGSEVKSFLTCLCDAGLLRAISAENYRKLTPVVA